MEHLPEQTPRGTNTPIVIDSSGDAHTEFTRKKEAIIRHERLDSLNPIVHIDLERILTSDDGVAVTIVIQDFGLPPRLINVHGDFVSVREVGDMDRGSGHYSSAPKKLGLSSVTPENGDKTRVFDDKGYPIEAFGGTVGLDRGESMYWAHHGGPSDERSGYISGGMWELTALDPNDYYGSPDFSDGISHWRNAFTPMIGISYADNILSIYSLDDVHADILFQQIRSLEDSLDFADEVIEGDLTLQEALVALSGVMSQLHDARQGMDNLETILASNKEKLRDARREASSLRFEIDRLKRSGNQQNSKGPTDFPLFSKEKVTPQDPHGYCGSLGINPQFLFALPPEIAKKYIKGVHKALVMGFHSDVNQGKDDESMKQINIAVDGIVTRLDQGFWA